MVEIIELPHTPTPRKVGLYVAAPCFGCVLNNHFVQSLLSLQVSCMREGVDCFVDMIGNESLVQRARNILTARFLKSKHTHLVFIDSDIGFDPDSVLKLVKFTEDRRAAGEDTIATAIYPKKMVNWDAVAAKTRAGDPEPLYQAGLDFNINVVAGAGQPLGTFVEVLDAATGFMCAPREVLERMAVYFASTLSCVNDISMGPPDDPRYVGEYVAVFDCMIDPVTRRYLSEDYAFCRRWQQMGGKIYADVSVPLVHVGNHVYEGDIRRRLRVVYAE
jgi:hypothetical protein